jgi:DNA-binding NtrC family response regulator
VLVIDPDPVYRAGLEELLDAHRWVAILCDDIDVATRQLGEGDFDVMWMEWDQRHGSIQGPELLRRAHEVAPDVPLLVVTSSPEVARVRAAAKAVGAMSFSKGDALLALHCMDEMLDARALDESGERPSYAESSSRPAEVKSPSLRQGGGSAQ